jgi:AcrR family transcriptional regulator
LFIETLRRDHQQAHALFTALYDDTKTFEQVLARLRDMYSQQYRDDKSLMNWSEARILAARDREFRARLSVVDAERHGDINVLVEYVFRRAGITPPAPVSLMAMGFASLFEGVKMTMLSAPTGISPEDAETLLNLFIESFIPHPNEQDAGQSGPSAANPVR